MKRLMILGTMLIFLVTVAMPSRSLAQSWWEGFANSPEANGFWQWLQYYPGVARLLHQDPYQMYDPDWREQYPAFQQYINNNPDWWNNMRSAAPRYYGDPFKRFLNNHPQIAQDLSRNPDLIYDRRYRAQHPALNQFLTSHPNVWRSMKYQSYAYSPSGGWGAYNSNREWRNSNWWRTNGDWDDRNQWHDRNWWQKNNRAQAQKRHPDWFNHQRNN